MASATLTGTNSSTSLTVGLTGDTNPTYRWEASASSSFSSTTTVGSSATFDYSGYTDTTYIRAFVTDANGTEYDDIAVIKVYKDVNSNTRIDITFGSEINPSIGYNAFIACTSLASVVIGDSVESIGQQAFYACRSLASVVIGDSVTSIGLDAFSYCTSLATLTIGDSVTSIGEAAFYGCTSLATLTIGDSVTSIGLDAFYECTKIATITVLSGNTTFFTDSRGILYQITSQIPNVTVVLCPPAKTTNIDITIDTVTKSGTNTEYTVTSIVSSAFTNCISLESVVIGDSVTSIGSSAFAGCNNLASVVIGDAVESIGKYAFSSCTSLTTVTIPNSVESIGQQAFYACTSLASVVIGDSVTSIGLDAFTNCKSLANIYFLGAKPNITNSAKKGSFLSNSNDTAYYRADQPGWYTSTTITGISKIRRIPTIDTITATQITGSCDNNLSPVLVYISTNNGLTWGKYRATKSALNSNTWTLDHKFANRQSFKVSTIANYYNATYTTYCKSGTNDNYLPTTDASLSTFTIADSETTYTLDDGFAVTFPKGTSSVDVTAIPTKTSNPRAGVSITVNGDNPILYRNGTEFVNTKSISLNPGENEVTITVTILSTPDITEDYTGYIHVLPAAPVITTTFTTGTTGYTNDNTPTLSGTTDAAVDADGKNTTVTLYTVTTETITGDSTTNSTTIDTIDTYTLLGEATVTAVSAAIAARGNGKTAWTFTPSSTTPSSTDAFADGTYTIVATAQYSTSVTDLNVESDYSNAITFIVDTVAPNKPVIMSTIKKDVISGTAEANSTVLIKKDGAQVATAAVNSEGVWTLNVASISSYAPARYSYVDRDAALNVSDATTFDTSQLSIRYPPITFQTDKSKMVMPVISGRLSGDTSTVFTVANQSALKQIGGSASIDPARGRLTVKSTRKGSATIIVRAYSPIYGTKIAPVKITVK